MSKSSSAYQQLHLEADALRAVLDELGAYIFIKNADGCYTYANPPVLELFGLPLEQVIGKDDSQFFDLDVCNELRLNDLRVLQHGETIEREETNYIKGTGETRVYWSIKKPLRDATGTITGICGISSDITELHLLKEEMQRQASTDALTGLHNRRSFYDHAHREFSRSLRSHRPMSVIAIDIDHFKRVNDQYGHPVGDAVLCAMAKRCLEVVREEDLLARTGGEEFSLILPETPLHIAMDVAERLRELFNGHDLQIPDQALAITVSLGVAMRALNDKSFDNLFSRADQALYQAKQQGRNQVCGES